MKNKKVLSEIVVKNSSFLIIAITLSFILSELVVIGSEIITDAVNTLVLCQDLVQIKMRSSAS